MDVDLLVSASAVKTVLGLSASFLILYTLYVLCKPHPIPGIPYDERSAKTLLGNLPDVISHSQKTGRIWDWVVSHNSALNSPIVQIFPQPFLRPWVIVTDFRESQDILMRRTKEFDRSHNFANVFKGMVPDHHITMLSSDPKFKAHRKLIQDLMTPAFLNEIAAPRIYEVVTGLYGLWSEKIRLANGRTFSASEDVYRAALDAIWSVTFPNAPEGGVIAAQLHLLAGLENIDESGPNSSHIDVKFPETEMTTIQRSILTLTESFGPVIKSPLPILTYRLLGLLPYMKKATAQKEAMITRQLDEIKETFGTRSKDQATPKCAMEFILYRELAAATREKRPPVYNSRMIYDELFGLLVAGHDTTSATLLWGLKHLTDNQDIQTRLRNALKKAFVEANNSSRRPTVQEITRAHIAYLDATQEEIIRTSLTASVVSRTAMQDTDVLGHRIPKGTTLWFMNNGPDFMKPPVGIVSEGHRSESSQGAKARTRSWDPQDLHIFKPERWLAQDGEQVVFNLAAGPQLGFGLGPRGCFGKRLAYLQLKVLLVLLVWDFRLMPIPDELGGFDAVDGLVRKPKRCYVKLAKA